LSNPASDPPPVIALDVGGSSIKSGIVRAGMVAGETLRTTPIDSNGTAQAIIETIGGIIAAHLAECVPHGCTGVAFAFPGPFDYVRGVSLIAGLKKYSALYGQNITDLLRPRFPSLPIRYRNDAEAAIVGEARHGAGSTAHRLIGVTLGTGCGSAFVVDGQPQTGGDGVPPNGWLYAELFQGQPADEQFSTRGLLALLKASDHDAIRLAAERARAVDMTMRRVFALFGARLGLFLAPYVAQFRADAVLVTGGIAHTFDLFGNSLAGTLSVPVVRGSLSQRAAVLGAAALFDPPP
jgi:glucokinase